MSTTVAILDYGAGNLRSAVRALERHGVTVSITADPSQIDACDGLVVPGVGAFASCMEGIRRVDGVRTIRERVAAGRPVLGICVGMQIMFDSGVEHGQFAEGIGVWPGQVDKLEARVLPHMGWNTVTRPADMTMFDGLDDDERFYFVHSYGMRLWAGDTEAGATAQDAPAESTLPSPPMHADPHEFAARCYVARAQHEDGEFVAAVQQGALWATQFHPEKSGDAGARLLRNWTATL